MTRDQLRHALQQHLTSPVDRHQPAEKTTRDWEAIRAAYCPRTDLELSQRQTLAAWCRDHAPIVHPAGAIPAAVERVVSARLRYRKTALTWAGEPAPGWLARVLGRLFG